jgi:hypothetical protein
MENNAMMPKYRTQRIFMIGALLLHSSLTIAAPLVVVKTYGQHVGGNIVYTQEVGNAGDRDVVTLYIANDTDYVSLNQPATRDRGELRVLPLGSNFGTLQIVPSSVSGPSGWTAQIVQIEHSGQYIAWRSPAYPEPAIAPGQTATFRITVPAADTAYLTGHFSARLIGASNVEAYNGIMEKLDVTPPTLTLTVSPTRLQVAAGKLVTINATISVKDNYDPAPAIKLESITANKPLATGDIAGAAFGTDDRQFQLRDVNVPKGSNGRVYTITYSATDASGNKATASATVGVK